MMKMPMSRAASGLLRALHERAGADSDRILLSDVSSFDWRSLTLEGERHQFRLRITGDNARALMTRLRDGLEDAEFSIAGQIVADIAVTDTSPAADGSVTVTVEALTIAE
jgi:D-Tyr-tRNAtyr deacylase